MIQKKKNGKKEYYGKIQKEYVYGQYVNVNFNECMTKLI